MLKNKQSHWVCRELDLWSMSGEIVIGLGVIQIVTGLDCLLQLNLIFKHIFSNKCNNTSSSKGKVFGYHG
jgi:hypothetical protein